MQQTDILVIGGGIAGTATTSSPFSIPSHRRRLSSAKSNLSMSSVGSTAIMPGATPFDGAP